MARKAKKGPTLREVITEQVTGEKPASAYEDEKTGAERSEAEAVAQWTLEMQGADRFFEKWHIAGDKTVRRFLGESQMEGGPAYPSSQLNLFYSNITTMTAILYAKLPKVEADRRFLDPNDDVARVAAEMVTRILQNDMNREDDNTDSVLRSALQDRLVPGLGAARVMYGMTEKDNVKTDEYCDVSYIHWKDVRWSPCRTAGELRWKAFRAYMRKPEVEARFGKEHANAIPYASDGPQLDNERKAATGGVDVPADKQAEIWEIWDKPSKCVYWWVKGYSKFLDKKENPLELTEFFPDALPMVANATTSKYIPKPDYALAQDLYTEIDNLETRISLLTAAARCVGVYDRQSKEIQRMLTDGVENQLIPVDNWAMFAEKGGLKGVVDWLPLEAVVSAIETLTLQQQTRIQQLYQVTGMSDIMRGQATTGGVTATEQRIKAQFGSTRMQAIQEEFGRFAQDLLNKKVQIIRNFYDIERIRKLSNIMNTVDAPLAEQALALIKNREEFDIRVAVRADTMAMIDYDSLKMERTEYLQAVSQFMGQSMGLVEQQPEAAPFLLQLLRFGLAAYKGGQEIEGVIDQFAAKVEQKLAEAAQQPPPPNPEMIKAQAAVQKAQVDAQAAQQKMQMEMQKQQMDLQMEQQRFELEKQKMQMELAFEREKMQLEREKMMLELQLKGAQAQQKMATDAAMADVKLQTEEQRASMELQTSQAQAKQDLAMQRESHQQSMKQSEQQSAAKVKATTAQAKAKQAAAAKPAAKAGAK